MSLPFDAVAAATRMAHEPCNAEQRRRAQAAMAKYLISFPAAAMVVPEGDRDAVVRDSHAVDWAARLAKACRCSQELRVFGFDPQS
jgi:hypothetical protein